MSRSLAGPAAVVLAGGAGTRMGRPKADLPYGDSTLLAHAVGVVREAGCDPVVVAVRHDTPVVALPPGVEVVVDPAGAEGPLVASAHALERVPPGVDVVLFACDTPRAGPVVRRLVAEPAGVAVVAHDPDGRAHPLCCRVPRDEALTAAATAVAAGERRMVVLLERLGATPVPASHDELANLNTPADVAGLARRRR